VLRVDFSFAPEDEAWRLELRAWLEANRPTDLPKFAAEGEHSGKLLPRQKAWQRRLYDAGYVGVHWPKAYGGRGYGIERQVIFHEEMARAHVPRIPGGAGVEMIGPTMMAHATDAMKRRYLPGMLTGEELWCQGFSEPNAGSDLGGLQTRADLDGDEFVINGQKIWTGGAHIADYCALLCRTDPTLPKHRGISYLVVPMKSEGVKVQPIMMMHGDPSHNQVFFDNVRVPRENLIGELNRGWWYAQNTLGFERGPIQLSIYLSLRSDFDETLELARRLDRYGRPPVADPVLRQKAAAAYIDLEILRLNGYRMLTNILRGQLPSADVSPAKIHWGLAEQRLHEFAMDVQGAYGQLWPSDPRALGSGAIQPDFLHSRASTIYGGTGQIQRNITAERLLGMPR
jgi:alkylation response protein AidB-like acyl-CoA dehydrogenase